MKYLDEYKQRLETRGLDIAEIEKAVSYVRDCLSILQSETPEIITREQMDRYVSLLAEKNEASEERLIALARYFNLLHKDDIVIRLLAILLPMGVLEAMGDRLELLEGPTIKKNVFRKVRIPPKGSLPDAYPAAASEFVHALSNEIGNERAKRILKWNVHGIPKEAFEKERQHFKAAQSIDSWLSEYHARQVAELSKHAENGTLWYEQKITRQVVDFVRQNPEIQGGKRIGDTIYTTKIPYDPDRFLGSNDPAERRRLACHCPFVASTVTEKDASVHPLWCACSAGYEKFRFDVIFEEETACEVLESVITGAEYCRFAIKIPPSVFHKMQA